MQSIVRACLSVVCVVAVSAANAAESWTSRMGDLQNSGNGGQVPGLDESTASSLKASLLMPAATVSGTPVIAKGLLVVGDWSGHLYVFDIERGVRLINRAVPVPAVYAGAPYQGVQTTATIGTVTVPNGDGTFREELRAYQGMSNRNETLFCFNLDQILKHRLVLEDDPGDDYLCEGADWPISLATPALREDILPGGENVLQGSPIFSRNQQIEVNGQLEERDVVFTPTTGLDCGPGQYWAIDAVTAEVLWAFDPVVQGDGLGGTIWTAPAMNKDETRVFLTTGDCIDKPQAGEHSESTISLIAATGKIDWSYQVRLVDTEDLDIGNSPVVVDVEGETGCNVVVNPDKDGCMYGFDQARNIPEVGDPGFDPLRLGQQKLRWRTCFATGSLQGGFTAMTPAVAGRTAFAQLTSVASNVPGDDARGFAVDVCTGEVRWATSSVDSSFADTAVASDMALFLGGNRMDVFGRMPAADGSPRHLATVELPGIVLGGGGVAVVGDTIYVGTQQGVAAVQVGTNADQSAPVSRGTNTFAGPYPIPLSPQVGFHPDPSIPYPPHRAE